MGKEGFDVVKIAVINVHSDGVEESEKKSLLLFGHFVKCPRKRGINSRSCQLVEIALLPKFIFVVDM